MNIHFLQTRYLWRLQHEGRRARIRFIVEYLISEGWEEQVDMRAWPEWSYFPEWGVLDKIGRLTCRVAGHDPTIDHCCMPEHDYCQVCRSRTPGAAPRKTP